jgi:hypothetical protein
MALRWSRPGPKIWVSEEAPLTFEDAYGRVRTTRERFRIDGRNLAREGYRVDRGSLMGWEAIDGGQGFRSLSQAKRHVENFINEANAQQTLHPRGEHWQLARDRSRARRRGGR